MFKKKKDISKTNLQPLERAMYAFLKDRCGDFLLFVESQKDCHKFLYLPGADPFYLTFEDYSTAIEQNTLEFVDQLPEDIFQESLELSKRK